MVRDSHSLGYLQLLRSHWKEVARCGDAGDDAGQKGAGAKLPRGREVRFLSVASGFLAWRAVSSRQRACVYTRRVP